MTQREALNMLEKYRNDGSCEYDLIEWLTRIPEPTEARAACPVKPSEDDGMYSVGGLIGDLEEMSAKYAVMGPGMSGRTNDLGEAQTWLSNNPAARLYIVVPSGESPTTPSDLRGMADEIGKRCDQALTQSGDRGPCMVCRQDMAKLRKLADWIASQPAPAAPVTRLDVLRAVRRATANHIGPVEQVITDEILKLLEGR